MAGPGDPDGEISLRGRMHERNQFVFRTRLCLVSCDEGLVTNPIAPVAARPQLRQRPWRDIGHVIVPKTEDRSNADMTDPALRKDADQQLLKPVHIHRLREVVVKS